jgi:tripartite motif-containing protein 71
VTVIGSRGSGPGQLDQPLDVAVDGDGNIFVADAGNDRVQLLTGRGAFVREFTNVGVDPPQGVEAVGDGGVLVATGFGTDDGVVLRLSANDVLLDFTSIGTPSGKMASDVEGGFVYIADLNEHTILRVDRGTLSPRGFIGSQGSGNGQFQFPIGVAVDREGVVYVGDTNNNRIQKFRRDGSFLGAFGARGSGPGQFEGPGDVGLDRKGFVYVADLNNSRIQKLTADGKFVAAFGRRGAGPGEFDGLGGIAVDGDGVVYAADRRNHRVQRFDPV